jgi:hypothetical protein
MGAAWRIIRPRSVRAGGPTLGAFFNPTAYSAAVQADDFARKSNRPAGMLPAFIKNPFQGCRLRGGLAFRLTGILLVDDRITLFVRNWCTSLHIKSCRVMFYAIHQKYQTDKKKALRGARRALQGLPASSDQPRPSR